MKKISFWGFLVWLLIAAAVSASPRASQAQETESTVPELSAFHEIIYPIWHTAYPDKDYAALRSHAPEVKRLAESIYSARLPAILHEKQDKWDLALAETAKSGQGEAIAAAVEVVHTKYQGLEKTFD